MDPFKLPVHKVLNLQLGWELVGLGVLSFSLDQD